ncbi:MAG: Outer membrane protein assembly factor BamB [Phycisphaerae bacterium]|nr:Outer membrane protein assembly factor BamB [Phycisphaerae bacterium]
MLRRSIQWGGLALLLCCPCVRAVDAASEVSPGECKGLCLVLGDADGQVAIARARDGWLVCVQATAPAEALAVRQAAESAGLLGRSLFVTEGDLHRLNLADNLADEVLSVGAVQVDRAEILRVLRPGGRATIGGREIIKPQPEGADAWSHPYHGPDNNPQSADRIARAPYLTQFIADPAFGCMPEVTVAAGGRVFRAFGHLAFRQYQNPVINTLFAVNAFNGTILWTRPLTPGFMIHRNTMIATEDLLLLGDDTSCKLIDAATGRVTRQILVPEGISDGPVFKWMALADGVLYALVGAKEVQPPVQKGQPATVGGWPWAMWPGFDYADPKTAYGFGRTLVAFDVKSGDVLWHHRENDYIDSRGTCLSDGKIFYISPGRFLARLDCRKGAVDFKANQADLMEAIGPNGRAQGYRTGFASTTYLKAFKKYLLLAGPQRPRLVAVSAETGKLLWQRPDGNLQIVLRDDAIYAAGGQGTSSYKLDYETGRELARFTDRRACTRATGSIDSIFYRAKEGTVRMIPATGTTEHIAAFRPPCESGVIVSQGLLHWGPWICGCRLAQFGHIALGPAGAFEFHSPADDASRFQAGPGDPARVQPLEVAAGDWPAVRMNLSTDVAVGQAGRERWTFTPESRGLPSPAIAAAGLVFVGGGDGVVRALNEGDGTMRWQAFTGAAIRSAPALWNGRLYVGSADGWLYTLEAATGRLLWRYRVAPTDRWIPVFGHLQSTWPVAGGAAVADGVVYAAAGMAHYDGTYVVALDAVTGKLKWSNDGSGSLSKVHNGIEVRGPLYVDGDAICFAGGNVYAVARFNRATGRCLNTPVDSETSSAYCFFSLPLGLSPGMQFKLAGELDLSANNNRGQLTIGRQPVNLLATYRAFALAGKTVLAAGSPAPGDDARAVFALAAGNIDSGAKLWSASLPACPVPGGVIVTRSGRVVTSLADGRIVCFDTAAQQR